MPEISQIIKIAWNNLTTKCSPLPSMPEKYNTTMDFKENISASAIIDILAKKSYKFLKFNDIILCSNNLARYNNASRVDVLSHPRLILI